tara:strand:- start:114 stop:1160 length:1047 start_codon:yes stop_codon:yes gene_type:complete
MYTESAQLSLLSIFSLICFFIFLITKNFSNKIRNGVLLDKDFEKPQAFHSEPISRCGGLAAIISLIIFILINYLLFGKILNDYLFLPVALFLIGFSDDLKIKTNPSARLSLMILILSISIIFLSINIDNMDVPVLREWMLHSRIFETFFILLCFLFIINGANLIDGFNGLLAIHLLIINFILLFISINNNQAEFALLITAQIIIFFILLLFNFPSAKIFLGDGGSYLFGAIITLNIIETNNANPQISSFFFCTLLFYLFFEVFFSFFRKIYQKKSPLLPDGNHLHMLIHKKMIKKNYLTSLFINVIYLFLIMPGFYFMENPLISRIWFFSLLIFYLISYYLISRKSNT